MKNQFYIILTLLFLVSNKVFSQDPTPKAGSNLTNLSLDKFAGSWIYTQGTDTVKLMLKKENIFVNFGGGFKMDFVLGCYSFKKGNKIIENYLPFFNQIYNINTSLAASNTDGGYKISGSITDKLKKRRQEITMLLSTDLNTLNVTLQFPEGLCLNCIPGRTLPEKMVFKRVIKTITPKPKVPVPPTYAPGYKGKRLIE